MINEQIHKQRFGNIDCLKTLCAVLVVFIHVPCKWAELFIPITRCAVPVFFMISGYFLYNEDESVFYYRIKRSIPKILFIIGWATIVFAIWALATASLRQNLSLFWERIFSLESLLKFIVLNENPFGYHLWYLMSYLYTLLVCCMALRGGFMNMLYWAIPFLLIAGLVFGKYSLICFGLEVPPLLTRNFFCVGIPFFLLGAVLRKVTYQNNELSSRVIIYYWAGVILFSILSVFEKILLEHYGVQVARDHYLSTNFLAVTLFLAFLSIKVESGNIIALIGRRYSLYLYILHPLVIPLVLKSTKLFSQPIQDIINVLAPMLVVIITLISIAIGCKLLHSIKNTQWFKQTKNA